MGNKRNKRGHKTTLAYRRRAVLHRLSIARSRKRIFNCTEDGNGCDKDNIPSDQKTILPASNTSSGEKKNQDNSEIMVQCGADDSEPEKQGHTTDEVNASENTEDKIKVEWSEELERPSVFDRSTISSPSLSDGSCEGTAFDEEPWLVRQQLCRCCHSEGAFWSLQTRVGGATYAHLLHTYFNVQMCEVPSSLDALCAICAVCAARLRDARDFSAQVRSAEERFQRLYAQNRLEVAPTETEIKEELPDHSDSELIRDNDDDAVDFPFLDEERPKLKTKRKKVSGDERPPKERPKLKTKRNKVSGDERPPKVKRIKRLVYHLIPPDFERHGDTLTCTRCDKQFSTVRGLRYHVQTVHMNMGKYTCAHCSETFKTLASFMKHKLDEHSIDDRVKCNACDSIFNTKVQLVRHKDSFHMLGVKHACPHCDYVSFSVDNMRRHKLRHKTVKENHCKYCKKSFLRKSTLDLHERIHTGDRRKVCKECGQAFVQKASLNYHMTKYHPEVKF